MGVAVGLAVVLLVDGDIGVLVVSMLAPALLLVRSILSLDTICGALRYYATQDTGVYAAMQ